MHIPKPSSIHTKFICGLLISSIILGLAFSIGFYAHMKAVLEEEVQDKALLIFRHVDSIQQYVRTVLRPSMYARLPEAFIIEAMSTSYVSRTIMTHVNDDHAGTIYRRVGIGARNPAYEANAMEQEFIKLFRTESELELWQGYKKIGPERYYLMVRPVRFEHGCMYCHGKPEDAPRELLTRYGDRGFDKQLGAVAGVDFVGISVQSSVRRLQHSILTYFALFALGAVLYFSLTNVLFRVLVVNNLKRLSMVFRRNVVDPKGEDLLRRIEHGDEIDGLVEGMEQMGEHLFEARRQLHDYAENLRHMVDERTEALSQEVEARLADVRLFVRLLEDMRQSRSRAELWRLALPQICTRFGAQRIAYVCTMTAQNFFVWPEGGPSPTMPDDFVQTLTGGACVHAGSHVYVPVESGSGNAEGLLCLYWATAAEAGRHDLGVLQALGRQLGTAAENLTAIDSLLRQMNVLETIVEGITDPLALMDAQCTVLTVNRAARQLTSELSAGERTDGNMLPLLFDLTAGQCPMLEAIQRGRPDMREIELDCGRFFTIFMYPVPGQDRQADRVVVYARETTMEKRMRAQVWQSEKMVTVGKLTAGLAHEINNPLGVILCYAGLLRQSVTDPQLVSDVDIIERHTRQAQRVLQDLLNFARPKAAGQGTADACAVAASVVEVFGVQAAKKGARLELERPALPLTVRLGVGELEQVLSNLVINALDALEATSERSAAQGRVLVRVERAGEYAVLHVEDNGPGVQAQDEPHIFDPFFTTKEIGAGTGLGLAVVYGLTHDVGGRVDVGRSPLGGAHFWVTLPMVSGDGNLEDV